ncbi:hypothetical protein RIF29_15703 [Crotalaria pallida]|uniref:Protein FAR1-RELATED SEQUENCE n=1 Tax=Crotalaria pallida TaxID=3830 RepID=A0AAN9FE40_CROPI
MFSDFDVNIFEKRWALLYDGCGLENHEWVKAAYAKKEMWSTAYMKGIFFAGLRTTSRCEAFHAQMRRYLASCHNLCEFVEQFKRCWELMCYNELRAHFRTLDTQPVLLTLYKLLEKSAVNIYTREVFELVQRLLFISAEYKAWSMSQVGESGSRSSTRASTAGTSKGRKNAPGNRTDIGWKHGKDIEGNARKVKCNYCLKVVSGGIYRFKHHLARTREDAEPCPVVSDEVKELMLKVVTEAKEASKKRKKSNDDAMEEEEEIRKIEKREG